MLQITHGRPAVNCQGMTRRTAIKAGFLGLLGLTQADLARARESLKQPFTEHGTRGFGRWRRGAPEDRESSPLQLPAPLRLARSLAATPDALEDAPIWSEWKMIYCRSPPNGFSLRDES